MTHNGINSSANTSNATQGGAAAMAYNTYSQNEQKEHLLMAQLREILLA